MEKEAQVVRLIYRMFLEGKTPSRLSKYLTEQKIPTPAGKKIWQPSTVKSILKNEKYKGDARLQKTFTVDFLTKKKKINEGEIPQYYVDNSHPAIVTPEVYELVQEEFRRLRAAGSCTSTINCFASRIVCGDCGGFYGRKIWHSNSKYRCTVWHCNNKFHKRKYCSTPTVKEEAVKKAFIEAFNSLIHNKAEILNEYDCIIEEISDMTELENQRSTLDQHIRKLEKEMEGFIAQNARLNLSQKEYNSRYDEYMAEHRRLQEQKQDFEREMTVRKAKKLRMQDFIATFKEQDALLTEFDEKLWSTLLSAMEIVSSTEVIFRFKDGMELPWQIAI